jgi:hypothetical protein
MEKSCARRLNCLFDSQILTALVKLTFEKCRRKVKPLRLLTEEGRTSGWCK